MEHDGQRVHNRFKLPFFLVCVVTGVAMIIGGAATGLVGLIAPGVIAVIGSLPPLWVIATGRGNPGWMRSRLDSAAASVNDRDGSRPADRGKYRLVLAGSVCFVVAGIALIAVGAATKRWDRVFVGAVGILFFGACAWFAVSLLRRSA